MWQKIKSFNLENFIERYYKYIIIFLLLVAFLRPLLLNIRYPLLTSWDTWNFLLFSKEIKDNQGFIPDWVTQELYPEGRPFLYPPLVPLVLANLSLLTGISLFVLIKLSTVFFYPLLAFLVYFLTLPFKNKKLSVLTLILFLSVNQAFINSLNSLSQYTEIFLLILIVFLIYKKRYNLAIFPFALMFWTHFFTPFCFGTGLFLYALYKKEERKQIFKTLIFGFLLGLPWLSRYLVYHDWVSPNIYMQEHFISREFFVRLWIESFSFMVILGMVILAVILEKKLLKKIVENRFTLLLSFIILSTLPIFYYPERAVTYVSPFLFPLSAFLFLNLSLDKLKKSSLIILPYLFFVVLFVFGPVPWIGPFHASFTTIALTLGAFLVWAYYKLNKKILFALILFLLIFFNPAGKGMPLPFYSWLEVHLNNLSPDAFEACQWLKQFDPNAIVATNSAEVMGACSCFDLKTSEAVVVEFVKDKKIFHRAEANYFIDTFPASLDRFNNDFFYLWKQGDTTISRLFGGKLLKIKLKIINPSDYPRVWFGLVNNAYEKDKKTWYIKNSCYFLLDEKSLKNKIYSLELILSSKNLTVKEREKKYSCDLNFIEDPAGWTINSLKLIASFQNKEKLYEENRYGYEFPLFFVEGEKLAFTDTPKSSMQLWWQNNWINRKISSILKIEKIEILEKR